MNSTDIRSQVYFGPVKKFTPLWPLVLLGVLAVFPLQLLIYAGSLDPDWSQYIAQPALWSALALLGYLGWRQVRPVGFQAQRHLILLAILAAAGQIALLAIAGLAFGFGESLMGRSMPALLGNLLTSGTMLLGMEFSRACLARSWRRHPAIAVGIVSILLTLVQIPPARWSVVTETPGAIQFAGEVFFPGLALNLLATYLAFLGGPVPALAYRGILLATLILSPILPDLPWLLIAFFGVVGPALGLIVVQSAVSPAEVHSLAGSAGPLLGLVTVTLLWFSIGVFGFRPTLVSGQSMEPEISAGDIAVIQQVPLEEIQVGDVIRFRFEHVEIVHRVIEIQATSEGMVFITQGDANPAPDPPVTAAQVDGKVVLVIPELGHVSLMIREVSGWVQ